MQIFHAQYSGSTHRIILAAFSAGEIASPSKACSTGAAFVNKRYA
jgi:hypothetical protein